MQPSSKQTLTEFLRTKSLRTALDAPSGGGWLLAALGSQVALDGIDLYAGSIPGYRQFWKHDLDNGLPTDCGGYDLICCCEGLEHVGNPLLLLREFHRALNPDGLLVVTTPNVWYPAARLQYLLRGFFPSFPPLAGKIVPGTHMHITPWSWPQLYVYFKLAGFSTPQILTEPLSQPKHFYERLLAWPGKIYCRRRARKTRDDEARQFWQTAASDPSLMGRHLMVVGQKVIIQTPAG
jgi:SAM-dependent methyltransferase